MNRAVQQSRAELRRAMRLARAQVGADQRTRFSCDIARHIARSRLLRPRSRIALFAALRDEPDSAPLLQLAAARGAEVFLPRIGSYRNARMSFAPVGGRWRLNRFGIAEPLDDRRQAAQFMNVIFVPLLAFDAQGGRLGMGGGYYDRALAFRRRRQFWTGPLLIGVAYEQQEVSAVPMQDHDVYLDGVVTPRGLRWFESIGRTA